MRYKICLSVAAMDAEFEKMAEDLREFADVDIVGLNGFSLAGYDIFVGKKLSKTVLGTADKLKVAFAYKTGVDDFPLQLMDKKGIKLVNSHVDSAYIAEYAFGLSISLVNRITECDKKLRKGIWYDSTNPYWESIFEMKVGLLGYGHIGREVHRILEQNHIATYTIDRGKEYKNITLVQSLEELVKETNLVIISLPKTPETDCLFNKEIFKLMKDKYIVNVGRSNCINQADLYEALITDHLGGAAIDTWEKKPGHKKQFLNPSEYPFVELDNVVVSPHQAMRVKVGHQRYVMDTLEKIREYINSGKLRDVVDMSKGY